MIIDSLKKEYIDGIDSVNKVSFSSPWSRKLIEDEIGNLHNAPSIKEIKFIAKNLFGKKCPGPDSFAGKFELTFKEKVTLIL